MAIRRIAGDPGAERAVPALLGCIEAALHELACAATSLDETGSHGHGPASAPIACIAAS